MRMKAITVGLVCFFCVSNLIFQQHLQAQEKTMKFVGKKILLRYESGMEIKGNYKTSTEIDWEALAGPAKGMKGTERIQAVEITPEIFFISWFEESGTTVSQVLDFNKFTVIAFITFETGQGRQSALEKGTFTEIN